MLSSCVVSIPIGDKLVTCPTSWYKKGTKTILYSFERLLSIYSYCIYWLWSSHCIVHPWACLTPSGWYLSPPPLNRPPHPLITTSLLSLWVCFCQKGNFICLPCWPHSQVQVTEWCICVCVTPSKALSGLVLAQGLFSKRLSFLDSGVWALKSVVQKQPAVLERGVERGRLFLWQKRKPRAWLKYVCDEPTLTFV